MILGNRAHRRAAAKYLREQVVNRPAQLTPIARERWPAFPNPLRAPVNVWHSKKYLVQLFNETPLGSIETKRMSVCRAALRNDGEWEEGLSWEELQTIKREIGFGDWYGLEVYPRDVDVVNAANMRHLWLLATPLKLGWFA